MIPGTIRAHGVAHQVAEVLRVFEVTGDGTLQGGLQAGVIVVLEDVAIALVHWVGGVVFVEDGVRKPSH